MNSAETLKAVRPDEAWSIPVHFRPGTEDDWPLVYSTMLHGLYEMRGDTRRDSRYAQNMASPVSHGIDRSTWMREYHHVLDLLLSTARLLIAESTDSEHRPVLGYLLYENVPTQRPCLHYAHVKRGEKGQDTFRRNGIFHRLLREAGLNPDACDASHFRYDSEWLFRKWPGLCYNPFRAWARTNSQGART